jgi:hypothetical protein
MAVSYPHSFFTALLYHHHFARATSFRYAIPGFVFFAQNNLSFIALQHMTNAAFQLLLNMRIVAVALLTVSRMRFLSFTVN